jgi:hypothetical protein
MSILIISVVVLVFTLVCYGLYELFKTSTITTTPGPGSHPPGPGPPPTPPTPPTPPSYDDICKESDPTKCCGSSKKCQQSEDVCQCTIGKSYDCKQNKCVDNCNCPNGVPAFGKSCGKVYGATKCTQCNTGYGGSVNGCKKYTCGSSGGTKRETDCPGSWSCCHVSATSQHKCCPSGCSHGLDTCKEGDPWPAENAPGWN